jgi:microcystin-dependent protein
LTVQQIPSHTHPLTAAVVPGDQNNPGGMVIAESPGGIKPYIEDAPSINMNAGSATPAGGSQPHENTQPFLCINFIISLFGVFPSQT